jgi:hypothetical protein
MLLQDPPHRMLAEENPNSKQWTIFFIFAVLLILAVLTKISFDISINQLKILIPEAEFKI